MKRSLCLAVLIALLLPVVCMLSTVDAAALLYGDVNSDGRIDARDYVAVRRHILGIKKLDDQALLAADVDHNGKIDSGDYIALRRHCLGTLTIEQPDQKSAPVVAYIPLDNRPVNVERVQHLAEASGITLLMPEASLYANALDGQPQSSGGQLGDRRALLDWLKSVEDKSDAFIISLDMMLSGGLIGSRWHTNTDLSFEYSVADYIISLASRKKVYLFDTVMRLASTVGFGGYGSAEYHALRSYAAIARRQIVGSALTVDAIVSRYRMGEDGKTIPTNLTEEALSRYFASRERKLRLCDYVLRGCGDEIFCLVGVDDSSPQTTVQTNEIRYISTLLADPDRVFAGTDELGLMCFARFCADYYGTISVSTSYFGGGEDRAADGFDIDTLAVCLQKHYDALGIKSASRNDCDVRVLVLTQSYVDTPDRNASDLVNEYARCAADGIPTIIIDITYNGGLLAGKLFDCSAGLGYMVGYSSWNSAANAIGIALSTGAGRMSFLKGADADTKATREGYAKSIVFSLCKDIGYKVGVKLKMDDYISKLGAKVDNYYPQTTEATRSQITARLTSLMTSPDSLSNQALSALMKGGMLSKNGVVRFPEVSLTSFRLPWYRTFEASFDINVG